MPNSATKKNSRMTTIIIIDVLILAAIIFYFGAFHHHHDASQPVKIEGIYLDKPQVINDFQLTTHQGKLFNKESLKGHWTMMFFGFTNCPMVCPTTMASLNKMYQLLQPTLSVDKMPQIVFVSVDPDRDTQERISDYMNSFNANFIGVRAEMPETIALEKQFHIAAAKMQTDDQGENHYTINHSSEILLINPEAKIQAYLSFPHKPEQMVKDYQSILATYKG